MRFFEKTIAEKILLVSYEMSYTGSPRALLNLTYVLKELGYKVDVWTLNNGPFKKEFAKIDINVRVINFPEEDEEKIGHILIDYKFIIAITIFCVGFASFAKNYTKTILYIMEAKNIPDLIGNCERKKQQLISISHILCVSSYARDFLRDYYFIENIFVLQNYVEHWNFKRSNLVIRKGKIRFLVSGTVEWRKGQDVAEEAFFLLPEEFRKKSELHFLGLTPEWSRDYQNALYMKKDERIFFHKVIEEQDKLFEFYRSMDVILITSRDESCSLVALEAAMLKKALLVTENTGAKYIVNGDSIVPTGDPIALSKKMEGYIRNPIIISLQGRKNYKKYLKYGTRRQYKKTIKKYLKEV